MSYLNFQTLSVVLKAGQTGICLSQLLCLPQLAVDLPFPSFCTGVKCWRCKLTSSWDETVYQPPSAASASIYTDCL